MTDDYYYHYKLSLSIPYPCLYKVYRIEHIYGSISTIKKFYTLGGI